MLLNTYGEERMEKTNEVKTYKTAHSNFRRGLSDYNDGSSLTHQLGNDDYPYGNNEADPYKENCEYDGTEAQGNNMLEDDDFDLEEDIEQ
jgi:hypothetical protein